MGDRTDQGHLAASLERTAQKNQEKTFFNKMKTQSQF